jgi:hypothetical protein
MLRASSSQAQQLFCSNKCKIRNTAAAAPTTSKTSKTSRSDPVKPSELEANKKNDRKGNNLGKNQPNHKAPNDPKGKVLRRYGSCKKWLQQQCTDGIQKATDLSLKENIKIQIPKQKDYTTQVTEFDISYRIENIENINQKDEKKSSATNADPSPSTEANKRAKKLLEKYMRDVSRENNSSSGNIDQS